MSDDIVRVAAKVRAFRADFPPTAASIETSFTEDIVGNTARVIGHCIVRDLTTDKVMAEAHGTRALREPIPGAQGHRDTRDPDRAMTQATGRALGLLGYADGESLEGDTDEPDDTGVTVPAFTKTAAKKVAVREFRMRGYDEAAAKTEAAEMWTAFGMDGLELTEQVVVEKVGTWLSDAEPFPESDGGVEAQDGTIVGVVPDPEKHGSGAASPLDAVDPTHGDESYRQGAWKGTGSMDDNGTAS